MNNEEIEVVKKIKNTELVAIPNDVTVRPQPPPSLSAILPKVIDKADFEEAVDNILGAGLIELYSIVTKKVDTDDRRSHIFEELKIKAMNSIIKIKEYMLKEKMYQDSKTESMIEIPDNLKLGVDNNGVNDAKQS